MKKIIGIMNLPAPQVLDLQRSFNQKNISEALIHKEDKSNQGKLTRYIITILYKKPEYGESVSFHSTYRAMERKDPLIVKRIFGDAFHLAHPSWIVEKVTVKED